MLASAAETYKHAVGVVVIVIPGVGADPIGTAWAFEPNLFATNAHVVAQMEAKAAKYPGAPFYIAINGRPDKRLQVVGRRAHPKYGQRDTRFDGRTAVSGYDVGVLRTSEPAPAHFTLADASLLQGLRAGVRVAYLGFPMEALAGDNVDVQMPIATMQSGIVTSVSDAFMADGGFDKNRLIRHNLPTVGGSSGSPIFTPDGKVVAINWGGNHNFDYARDPYGRVILNDKGDPEINRSASAALVNFAERIDTLREVPRP